MDQHKYIAWGKYIYIDWGNKTNGCTSIWFSSIYACKWSYNTRRKLGWHLYFGTHYDSSCTFFIPSFICFLAVPLSISENILILFSGFLFCKEEDVQLIAADLGRSRQQVWRDKETIQSRQTYSSELGKKDKLDYRTPAYLFLPSVCFWLISHQDVLALWSVLLSWVSVFCKQNAAGLAIKYWCY